MALTLPEASKLSRRELTVGLFKTIATTDELAAILPFKQVAGTSYDYLREKTLPSVAWADDTGATAENSEASSDRATVPLRRLIGNVDVDNFAQDLESGQMDQTAMQIAKKMKAAFREIARMLISGAWTDGHTFSSAAAPATAITAVQYGTGALDSSRFGPGSIKYTHAGQGWQFRAPGDVRYGAVVPATADGVYTLPSDNPSKWIKVTLTVATAVANGEFLVTFTSATNQPDGLNRLMDPAQVIASGGATGDSFSFSLLDRMIHTVKADGLRAFVMTSRMVEKLYAHQRAMGGATPEIVINGQSMAVYKGFPVLRNDFIANETKGGVSTLSSIYFTAIGEENGGIYAPCGGGESFDVEADPRSRPVLGFKIDRLGDRDTHDAKRHRVKWYGAFAMKSPLAACRAMEISEA